MNDLRYNIYGGARYPAPAVVGGFGSGLSAGISGAMNRTGEAIASATGSRPRAAVRRAGGGAAKAPADTSRNIEVYRGTVSDQVKVGGNGR
jgi:pilus assembly protein CpaB